MKNENADFFHEAFVYLYRCWLQLNFNKVPICCVLGEKESLLECDDFILYYTDTKIDLDRLKQIKAHFKKQLYFIAPEICNDSTISGLSLRKEKYHNSNNFFRDLIDLIKNKKTKIKELVEVSRERMQMWETKEYGIFKLCKGPAERLILYSKNGDPFGYTFISNKPDNIFVKKSKSCKEEGRIVSEGFYKLSSHTAKDRISINIDLISNKKEVSLLKLQPAGVGYKIFKRASPEAKEIIF